MAGFGKEIRDWVGSICTVVGTIALFGVPLTGVAPWVQSKLPFLAWIIGTVSVPWLGVVLLIVTSVWIAYRAGKAVSVRAAPREGPASTSKQPTIPSFQPSRAQREIIRAIRHMDGPVLNSELVKMVTSVSDSISARQVELAADSLSELGWLDGKIVWTGTDHEMQYQLEQEGMAYAVEQGFEHFRPRT